MSHILGNDEELDDEFKAILVNISPYFDALKSNLGNL